MKKYFVLLIAVFMLFTFVGCDSDKSSDIGVEYKDVVYTVKDLEGSWYSEKNKVTLNFDGNGNGNALDNGVFYGAFNYTVEDNKLTITYSSGSSSSAMPIEINGNDLKTTESSGLVVHYTKK